MFNTTQVASYERNVAARNRGEIALELNQIIGGPGNPASVHATRELAFGNLSELSPFKGLIRNFRIYMKRLLVPLCLLLISGHIYSQAREETVTVQRQQQQAAVIELAYAPETVKAAMNDYLSKKGKSQRGDIKGYTTYRNTDVLQGDSANADLNFKIERKSRQEKQVTMVSLLVTPAQDRAGKTGINYLSMEEAKTYLNDLVPAIDAYNLEQKIKDQNEAIGKSETMYKSLISDGENLEKKKSEFEKKITDNKQQQQAQIADLDAKKQQLAALVGQRKL